MLETYHQHVADRAALGIPPLPLSAQQTADLIELLKTRRMARRRICWSC
ncbi:bifunctional aconitate hydratase 2/2-methylisocitrate dehydratase [Bordetella pertussis]|nr:bifunctional aconitate hydratase 2/2-methylisocitrate dehydratase [Bordetella pertussis]